MERTTSRSRLQFISNRDRSGSRELRQEVDEPHCRWPLPEIGRVRRRRTHQRSSSNGDWSKPGRAIPGTGITRELIAPSAARTRHQLPPGAVRARALGVAAQRSPARPRPWSAPVRPIATSWTGTAVGSRARRTRRRSTGIRSRAEAPAEADTAGLPSRAIGRPGSHVGISFGLTAPP